jgi:hypothetical protein
MPRTAADVPPMERITPISRARSTTLMDMVLISPMLPTTAASTAITSIRYVMMLNCVWFICRTSAVL